jgi:type I restriction enzyme S subunit
MREMKDSGIEWIHNIPDHWAVHPVYTYFGERKSKNHFGAENNLLSLSYGRVIRKDINTNDGLLPESFNTYNIVETGDIIIRPTDLQNDQRSLRTGLVKEHGIITSAYIDLYPIKKIDSRYFQFLLHTYDVMKVFYNMGNGVRQSLNYSEFSRLMVFEPNYEEQVAIADFLDDNCAEIDALSADIQAQIDTLAAYRQSVITEAVTKGLNPDVEMKESMVEWCPQIPAHWKYSNPKGLFALRNDRAFQGDRQLTASQEYGIVYQDEYMEMTGNKVVTVEKDFSILKHVEPDDFVISMRSFQGGLEYSEKRGCISSAYVMLIPNKKYVYAPFYRWFFKSSKYINAIQSTSNLVRDGQAMRYANFVKVPLFIIPIEEQQQIAEYLTAKISEVDEILSVKQQQLTTLADYKKSLIYEYVTGKKEVPVS